MNYPFDPLKIYQIGDGTLVIYRWNELGERTSPRFWENLEFFDKDGKKLWTVNGMENCKYWDSKIDCFVDAGLQDDRWVVSSFSRNTYFIDLETGRITYSHTQK